MASELARRQAELVDLLLSMGVLTQPAVESAFRAVPRHLFLPELSAEAVYRDEAIPTKMEDGRAISSSSQPAMMALMLEQLELAPGQRVLEIGAGTGYNAALLGRLVGPGGLVVTLDIDEDIVAAAAAHLAAAGAANVRAVHADGGYGYALATPYDRIILTVGAWDVAPAWYEQLRPGGRLVLPLRLSSGPQESLALDRTPAGVEPMFISRSARDCGFMPLRGAFAGPEVVTTLGPIAGLTLATETDPPIPSDLICRWLAVEPVRLNSAVTTSQSEAFGSLSVWLGLHAAGLAAFTVEGEQAEGSDWPSLFQMDGATPWSSTVGLLSEGGLALLDRVPAGSDPFELAVAGYGPQAAQVAHHLTGLATAWDAAGRPPTSRLRVRVYGRDYPYRLAPGEVLKRKRWTNLVIDWPEEAVTQV